MTDRFNEKARGDVRNDHHRNHPAKNQPEKPRENDIRVTRYIEKIEIAIDQSLRTNDPKAHRGQAEHDGVMHGDSETKRHHIEQNGKWVRHDAELEQRDNNHEGPEQGVDNAVERELFRGHRELAVDWQHQNGIQFSHPHQLGDICEVNEKERLEKLGDYLVCADQQDHFPFCPVTDAIDIPKNDAEENDLPQNQRISTTIHNRKFALKLKSRMSELRSMME